MKKSESGVALIFTLGILTLLLVLGVTFVLNMMGENRATENFVRALRARLAAQAGIERAIVELKLHAKGTATDSATESWAWNASRPSYDAGGGVSGTLSDGSQVVLKITDGNSQINLNLPVKDVASSDLVLMLQQLPGLDATKAGAIITYRNTLPDRKFKVKEQAALALADRTVFDQFKEFVTVNSLVDPNASQDSGQVTAATATTLKDAKKSWSSGVYANASVWIFAGAGKGQERKIVSNSADTLTLDKAWNPTPDATSSYSILARSPVDVNTASDDVLRAVLGPVGGTSFVDPLKAQRPVRSWKQFDSAVSDTTVRNNANPNRAKPSPHTTEFCFNGGGFFQIESTGRILDAKGTSVLSEQKIISSVQIYKIWSESQKWQWTRTPEFYRVTWLDTCPTDLSGDTGIDFPSVYAQVANALKIGYWDNFQEDNSYTNTMWATNVSPNGVAQFDLSGGQMQFTNPGGLSENKFPEFLLAFKQGVQVSDANSEDSWNFNDFYLRVTNNDDTVQLNDPMAGEGDVGRIRFRSGSSAYYAWVRNKGLKYVEDTGTTLSNGKHPYVQQYIFEKTVDDGNGGRTGTGTYEETGTKYTGRKIANSFGVVQDLDGTPMKIPSGDAEKGAAVIPAPADSDKPQTTDWTFYVKFISRAVFELTDSGPDGHLPPGPPDPSSPYFLYPYAYTIPGSVKKAYRLTGRDVHSPGKDQAVSMQVQDSGGTHDFPGSALTDGEVDTSIRRAGMIGLMGNSSLPSWDDIRIVSPDGNLKSAVWDADENAQLGTVVWTNSATDETNEAVSVDIRSSASANMTQSDGTTPVAWSYSPTVYPDTPPQYERNISTGEIINSGQSAGNQTGRYLQYRVYLETRRPYSTSPGNLYLKATPVLEDITITYLPRAKVLSSR